jgi:outer membrane protein TolC
MGINLTQPLFNPSFISLPAAKVYTTLVNKQVQKTKQDVKAQITKAYYQVMVGQEQSKVLDYNVARLDSSLRDLRATFKAGYVEQIDIMRLEVQRNNLDADRETTARSISLALANLKFNMGYPMQQPLTITDKLETATVTLSPAPEPYGAYNTRIEFDLMNIQMRLAEIDLKAKKGAYFPSLNLTASLGATSNATRFTDMLPPYSDISGRSGNGIYGKYDPVYDATGKAIYNGGYRWYANSIIGVNMNVPIWDSYSRHYIIQQSKLALKKVRDNQELLKNSIDFEVERANVATLNAQARLNTQTRNLALAKEVVRVTRIKYKQGVGTNLEVTNAETDLRVAQTNYYSAVYDALVAKVDADLATGRFTAN